MRLSLVLDSLAVPAWVAEVIRRLLRNPLVKIESLSTVSADSEPSSLPLSYRLYLRWDERRNSSKFNPVAVVDVSSELAGIPRVPEHEMESDAAIWLSASPPEAASRRKLKCGILRFVPSDPRRRNSGPPYYWELFRQEPVSGSAWELIPGTGEQPAIAAEGYSATEVGWSLRQNQIAPFAKAPALLERSLYRLSHPALTGDIETITSSGDGASRSRPTGDCRSLRLGNFIGKNFRRSVHRRVAYRGKEPFWFVAYRSDPKLFAARTAEFNTDGFSVVEAPQGSFFADPFPISHGGKTFIFVEDYPYREGKGVISVLEVGADGQIGGSAQRVLDRPYHLSYPFVFEHDGSVYMIPETMGSRRIELYKATAFPSGWELVHVLKEDIEAVDTTLWVQDGTYYFFTNVTEPGTTPNDLLYVYLSDSLTGEWRPHPANPICADVRSSRSAGNLFLRGNKLIRPAQDCSLRYGYACQLNEIQALSPTEYRERPLSRIEPNWYPGLIGTHTINSNETIEVIDGQIYRSRYG